MSRILHTTAFRFMQPLRLHLFDWLDVVLVSDPEQIQWLNQQPNITRPIDGSLSFLHRWLDRRLHKDLMFETGVLPVFRARSDPRRAERQEQLHRSLAEPRERPDPERDRIGAYVSGQGDAAEIGPTVQQWCGRLFSNDYRSGRETYEAGRLLANWASAPPWRNARDRMSGRLARAKATLATAARGDLHCLHATSIGMENVTRSVHKLRKAAARADAATLSPEAVLHECLAVPPVLIRGCSGQLSAPFLQRPLTPRTLIVFLLARAYASSGDLKVAFLSDTWSACPARGVVPDLLRAAWRAAHHDQSELERLSRRSWSRIFQRAVS